MTLEEIYYVGQTIAVVAILGSLAGIFIQLRLSNRIARSDFSQRATNSYSETLRDLMCNPALAEAFRKVMFERTNISPSETTQILTYLNLMMTAHFEAFLAYEDGLIERRLLVVIDHSTTWYLTAPVFLREWRRLSRLGLFSDRFIDHVNSLHAADLPQAAAQTPLEPGASA